MKWLRNGIQLLFLVVFLLIIIKGNMMLWLGLFVVSLLSALLFGRFYCGYICPMNTVMGVTGKISRKLHWQTSKVPSFLKSKVLSWIVLGLMIATMVLSKKVIHREIPILLILVVASIIITLRFEEWVFHNHVCPYGGLLRLTGKHSQFNTNVDELLCIGCKKCEAVCPAQAIQVSDDTKKAKVDPSICHQCGICVAVCPTNAIKYRKSRRSR